MMNELYILKHCPSCKCFVLDIPEKSFPETYMFNLQKVTLTFIHTQYFYLPTNPGRLEQE